MRRILSTAAMIAAGAAFLASPAYAQTATATMGVSLTVQAECTISADPLAFGSVGIIDAAVPAQADLTVQCTPGSAYSIGLNAGAGTGATTTNRLLTSGTNTLNYGLYQDAALQDGWGNIQGTDTLDVAAATGAEETHTVYGVVPTNQNVPVGLYEDTVTATIWYGTGLTP